MRLASIAIASAAAAVLVASLPAIAAAPKTPAAKPAAAAPAPVADLAKVVALCENADGQASSADRIATCTQILALPELTSGQRAKTFTNRAWAYGLEKKWDAALADYDSAIKAEPAWPIAYSEKGFARLRMGQYDQAISNYDKAIKIDPKTAYSFYGRGIAKMRKKDDAGGKADIEAARKLDPQVDTVFERIGFKL